MQRDPRAFLWDVRAAALSIQSLGTGMEAAAYAAHAMAQATVRRLLAAEQGYLALNGDKHALTAKGEKAVIEFVAKSRFGPYFLRPQEFNPI